MMIFPILHAKPDIRYIERQLDGWKLQIEQQVIRTHPKTWAALETELDIQLKNIIRVVPDKPLAELRKVTIWIHWNDPGTTCMAFHPSADYLKSHNMEPKMAGNVEIGNAVNFVSWTYEQPWMVLHELAHSYHFRVLPQGENNPDVLGAYHAAMDAHRYDNVRHWDGQMVKAYATTNQMEYFAETTESYFGSNDFYPFVRGELQTADPDGYALMIKVWGAPVKRVPTD